MPRAGNHLSDQDLMSAFAAGKKLARVGWEDYEWVAISDGLVLDENGEPWPVVPSDMYHGDWFLWQDIPDSPSVFAVKILSDSLRSAFIEKLGQTCGYDAYRQFKPVQYSREWQEIPGAGCSVALQKEALLSGYKGTCQLPNNCVLVLLECREQLDRPYDTGYATAWFRWVRVVAVQGIDWQSQHTKVVPVGVIEEILQDKRFNPAQKALFVPSLPKKWQPRIGEFYTHMEDWEPSYGCVYMRVPNTMPGLDGEVKRVVDNGTGWPCINSSGAPMYFYSRFESDVFQVIMNEDGTFSRKE